MVSKLKYGNTNTFFVRGINGNLLVDTDYAGTLPAFYRAIKEHNIKISDITYVLATHYHPDHIGLISELMELGVKLLLIDTQVEYIHFSDEIFSTILWDVIQYIQNFRKLKNSEYLIREKTKFI